MPLYEYRCPRCGAEQEVFARRISAVEAPACASCGAQMDRKVSRFATQWDLQTKLADAEAKYGKEVDAKMAPEPDWGEYARRLDAVDE